MKAGGTAVRVEASPDGLGLLCHPFMPFDPARDFPSQDRDQQCEPVRSPRISSTPPSDQTAPQTPLDFDRVSVLK